MIKAVIFDFDDTLCMSEGACFLMENETLARMGRPPMSRKLHQSNWGGFLDEVITVRSPGIDVSEFKKIHEATTKEFIKTGKFDKVSDENLKLIDGLTEEGRQIMVLTGRSGYETEHLMDPKHHLGSRIAHFYHKDNNPYDKPDPRVFEIIERDHGLKPAECVYIGDVVGDARAAKGAGLYFIATLEGGLRKPEDFAEYPVDVFIKKLSEVPAAIAKIEKNKKQQRRS